MRLLALGILAAVLSAGCALEAGDPGQTVETAETGNTTTLSLTTSSKIRTPSNASTAPTGTAPNPEPSPWFPENANVADENPEPSPWGRVPPVESQGGATPDNTEPNSGSRGTGSEETTQPLHIIGHRDVSDPQL